MIYDYLIWDFNGTILDDVVLSVQIENKLRVELNLPEITLLFYQDKFCHPVEDYYINTGFHLDKKSFAKLAGRFFDLYQPASLHLPLREGVREYIATQKIKGRKHILLSASERKNLMEQTDHFNITELFEEVLGLDDIFGVSKVQLAKNWLIKTSIDSKKMLVIGDTLHDYEVAQALGCDCVLLTGGYNSAERLATTGVTVLDSIAALADFLD